MQNELYKRIARIEAMAEAKKATLPEVLQAAYDRACAAGDAEEAAAAARRLRNRLLNDSDREMSLDRLSLDTSSATKFIASLGTIFKGDWAKYRQALRDIPAQPGFPFEIEFPKAPGEEGET